MPELHQLSEVSLLSCFSEEVERLRHTQTQCKCQGKFTHQLANTKTVRGAVIDAGKMSNREVYTEYFLF